MEVLHERIIRWTRYGSIENTAYKILITKYERKELLWGLGIDGVMVL
jgi:hypothetical protein